MQMYSTVASRNLIMAARGMLRHADTIKVITSFGAQEELPQNKTDTIVFRRPVPIDAAANGAPVVNATDYLMAEGVTPAPRTIQYQDVQCTVQQWGVLMKLTAKTALLYEDDVPKDMQKLVGQHMGTLEEMISYGVVRGGTNVVYAGGVASRSLVASQMTLSSLRRCTRILESAHGMKVTKKLKSGPNFGESAVEGGYLVFIHTDLAADVRQLQGFINVVDYGSGQKVHEREIGACEEFRFITSPYFRPFLLAGATVAAGAALANGLPATGSNAADVYPAVVVAEDAWGQVAVKGQGAIDPIYLPPQQRNHANPMGQFGYVGATFWKTAIRLNENWMVRLEVTASVQA